MHAGLRFISLIATALLSSGAVAGPSLDLVVSVVPASGICGATVQPSSISVACGLPTGVPVVVPPVLAATQHPPIAAGTFGPAVAPFIPPVITASRGLAGTAPLGPSRLPNVRPGPAGATEPATPLFFDTGPAAPSELPSDGFYRSPDEEPGYRQIGELPSVAGRPGVALYSGGVNISSWRMVSTDNVQHVELTIFW
ncbi:hypothetical protein RAMLITH_18255 [Ramlibacter sp. RBP-2]|uniref:Uncharacterized protein n=1 Tax=Ramlibacter lithotrophicus TaxID=2606681 RepID=A0A7X6DIG7_9BURK|nr:hypothetical protein [Ramlibacter lithotrophicus]